MNKDVLLYLVPLCGVLALIFTAVKGAWVSKQDAGNERMQEIARYIAEGAAAYVLPARTGSSQCRRNATSRRLEVVFSVVAGSYAP